MWTLHLQAANGQPDPMFTAGKVKIGRDPECDLVLSGRRVGARHAELFVSNEQGFLRDLGCGTQVNGRSVRSRPTTRSRSDRIRSRRSGYRTHRRRPRRRQARRRQARRRQGRPPRRL